MSAQTQHGRTSTTPIDGTFDPTCSSCTATIVGDPFRPHAEDMLVAYLLYPAFSALDVVGTFQVLAAAPGMESVFVSGEVGMLIDGTGLCPLTATSAIAEVAIADVVVVPGSDCAGDPDPALVEWLRLVHPTTIWTLSVGTGSSYLAAAAATAATHWAYAQRLSDAGITNSDQRVVRSGKCSPPLVPQQASTSPCHSWASATARPSPRPSNCPSSTTPNPPTTPAPRRRRPPRSASLVSSYYAQRCS